MKDSQRVLTVQDISCVGRCSTTVALPILSACGHETCILPSALLSTHTGGFGQPSVTDLSQSMASICAHWQKEGVLFNGIYTGYLGSESAAQIVGSNVDKILCDGGLFIVDPAMADHGRLYAGLDQTYADAMIRLCARSDVMVPNVTEACMMTGIPYRDIFDEGYIQEILQSIQGKCVVLTGAISDPEFTGIALREGNDIVFYRHRRIRGAFHGTGDIFASVLTGAMLRGIPLSNAAELAADFTYQSLVLTPHKPSGRFGVDFELALPELINKLK